MTKLKDIAKTCNKGNISIVVKTSKRCNIRPACEYCYDFEAQSKDKDLDMNLGTLENLVKKSVGDEQFKSINFVWHGGEPLIVGRDFYKKALEFQQKYNLNNSKIVNRIQTNSVDLDDKWIQFLKDNNFMMETSFDAFDNDTTRGKTDRVLGNILHAKELGYEPKNTMFICTNRNIHRLREAYDYFENIGLNFSPSPIISLGNACQTPHLAISPEEYGEALSDLLDYYVLEKDSRKIRVRILDAVLEAVLEGHQSLCSHGFCAYDFVAADHKGNIFPCAKVNDFNWSFGNINEIDKLSSIFNSEKYKEYVEESMKRLNKCFEDKCEVLDYCKGGCASNALSTGGYSKRDFYCQTYKIIFNHAIDLVNKLNQDAKKVD